MTLCKETTASIEVEKIRTIDLFGTVAEQNPAGTTHVTQDSAGTTTSKNELIRRD